MTTEASNLGPERKPTGRAPKPDAAWYRRLFAGHTDAVYLASEDGAILDANPAACRDLNRGQDDLLGLHMRDVDQIYHQRDFQSFWSEHPDERTHCFESHHIRSDGSFFPVEVHGVSFCDHGERFLYIFARNISAQRQAEDALKQSWTNLTALIDASPDSALLTDDQGRIIICNATVPQRLGLGTKDMVGHNVFHYMPPETAASRLRFLEQVIHTGEPIQFEDTLKERHYRHILYPVIDNARKVRRIAIFGHDITAFKETEQALVRQNELLAAIHQAQNLFISDRDSASVYQNMLHVLVQYTQSEFGFLDEVLHDPDGTPYKLNLALSDISWDVPSRELYEQLVQRKLEFRNLNNLAFAPAMKGCTIIANDVSQSPFYRGVPEGHPPLKRFMGIPLYFEKKIIGIAGVANRHDIYTDAMADALQPLAQACATIIWARRMIRHNLETEQHFKMLFDMNPDAAQITRLTDGRVIHINDGVTAMTGYTREDLVGKTTLDIDLWENPDDRRNILDAMNRDGRCDNYEVVFKRKDGTRLAAILSSRRFMIQGVPHIITVTRDVTELKRTEKQIHQRQKAESLGRMAGAIAHHFNNMLAAVIGNLELARTDLSPESRAALNLAEAEKAAHRAADMTLLMLTYLGQHPGKTMPLDWSGLIRGFVQKFISRLGEDLPLKLELPEEGPVIQADPVQMEQILKALITNAWEAMDIQGSGRITVGVEIREASAISEDHRFPVDFKSGAGPFACLRVADTGKGLDESTISGIFDPFFTDKFTGRGLGLPVTLGIVKTHGGCITVSSRPGKGSVFHIFLPLSSRTPAETGVLAPEESVRDLGSGTLLIIDDEEQVRKMLETMLRRIGFQVMAASGGTEALNLFRTHHRHLKGVISDLSMPDMNGWDILAAMHQMRPDMPLILASGYDEAHTMKIGNPSVTPGAFLHKPFLMGELEKAMAQAFQTPT